MVNYPTLVTNWQIEGKIIASVLGRKFRFNCLFKLFLNYNFIFPFRRFVLLFLLLLSSSNATKDLQLFCKFYSYCKTSLSLLQAAFLSYPPPCPQKSLQQISFFFLSPSVLFVFASFQSIWIINLSLSAKRLKKLKAFPWDIFQNNFHNFSPVIATAAAASAGATGRPGSPITSLIVPIMSY